MKYMMASAIIVASCLVFSPLAHALDVSDSIVGVWKITTWSRTQVATGKVEHLMGASPMGLIAFTRGGHVIAFVTAQDRKASGAAPITDEDRVALFKTMYAYTGSYRVEGAKIISTITNSWNHAWNGNVLVSEATIAGSKLTITSSPAKAAKDGLEVIFSHTYERLE